MPSDPACTRGLRLDLGPAPAAAGAGPADPTFTGAAAIPEFGALRGETAPLAVSAANVGGPEHARLALARGRVGNELMTGFLNTGTLHLREE